MKSPTKTRVLEFRVEHGLTQRQAADMIWVTDRTWRNYEYGIRQMPAGFWELLQIKARKL